MSITLNISTNEARKLVDLLRGEGELSDELADDLAANITLQLPPRPFQFEPGDRIRHRSLAYLEKETVPSPTFTIGVGGYFSHWNNQWYRTDKKFTSEDYARVDE